MRFTPKQPGLPETTPVDRWDTAARIERPFNFPTQALHDICALCTRSGHPTAPENPPETQHAQLSGKPLEWGSGKLGGHS